MDWLGWTILIAAPQVAFGLLGVPLITAYVIYRKLLVRTSPEKWSRESSAPDDHDHYDMYLKGKAWGCAHADRARDVSTVSEKLTMHGRYYDFGADRAVLILPGRSEGLVYSEFFAEPYAKAGWNVLVVDVRAHGLSEGKYNTIGKHEKEDALAWLTYLHDVLGNRDVMLHGLCIGGSTSLLIASDEKCPQYLTRVVSEGAFTNFYEVFRNQLRQRKRPVYPCLWFFFFYLWLHTGTRPKQCAPLRFVGSMRLPVLFIAGKEDISTLPEMTKRLVAACGSPEKRLVWMEHGSHSHLRYYNTEAYDTAITAFLKHTDEDQTV